MGGFGSGRKPEGRAVSANFLSLDVRQLQRAELLHPGLEVDISWTSRARVVGIVQVRTFSTHIVLGGGNDSGVRIQLEWTACGFGGERVWFRCPVIGCCRRAAKLYCGGTQVVACRHCYEFTYECQRETAGFRAIRRADKIRQRLDWNAGILNGRGGKPHGMHWQTFARLSAQHDAFVHVALEAQIQWMDRREKLMAKPAQ